MRIRRLDLTRFGCFTDYSLDFGKPDTARPDFHLIYGLNETGKSTLFAAVMSLLFGIEKRSAYGFLHDYSAMRIGAVLEIAGQEHTIARIKRTSGSLLGADDQPLPESILTHALGSIDRAGYTTMFSLDDDSLESGGETILESQGDLGHLLFSAATGLSELSRKLDDVRAEVDGIHRPRASSTELGVLKTQWNKLKVEQRELDLSAPRYNELINTRDTARADYDSAQLELDQAKIELIRCQRLLDALPIFDALQELRAKRDPLLELPDAPVGWSQEAQELSSKEASCASEIKRAERELVRLETVLNKIVVDEKIVAIQNRLGRLRDEESRFRTASDIPTLETELKSLEGRIVGCAARLGQPEIEDPSSLLLPVTMVSSLNALIETRSGLRTQWDNADKERIIVRNKVETAKRVVDEFDPVVSEGALEEALAKLRGDDASARIKILRGQQLTRSAEIEDALLILRPWRGDLSGLAAMVVPEQGRVERWKANLDSTRTEELNLRSRVAELEETCESSAAQIAAVKQSTGAVDDVQAAAVRAARDQTWQTHRALLGESSGDPASANDAGAEGIDLGQLCSTADSFESAMTENDALVELRGSQTTDIAKIRHLAEDLAGNRSKLDHVRGQLTAVQACQEEQNSEIETAMRSLGLPGDLEPTDLERWLERRDVLLSKGIELRNTESEINAAERSQEVAHGALGQAMLAVGAAPNESLPFSELISAAQVWVKAAGQRRQAYAARRRTLEELEGELEAVRESELQAAESAYRRWEESWSGLLAESWLGEGGIERSSDEVRGILEQLAELPAAIDKRDDLNRRIGSMRRDQRRFIESVGEIAAETDSEFAEEKVLQAFDELNLRLAEAHKATAARESKMGDVERARGEFRAAEDASSALGDRRTEMCTRFAAESLRELVKKLGQAESRAELDKQIESREGDLVRILKQSCLADAEELLGGASDEDPTLDEREETAVELESRIEAMEKQVAGLHHRFLSDQAAVAQLAGDAGVARLEEQQITVLLEMQEKVERYLRLKIGAAAAEQALRLYRDRHRSSMMKRCGEAFRSVTRGRYRDLVTTPGKDGDVLVGVRSTGGSLVASEMSKGTRFQLYLALRVAGYHEFAERGETLPFIADDIMETFDDERTAEAFRLLSSMAERGQVIYLTHHAHLRDIARSVCGDAVRVHELQSPDWGVDETEC